MSDVKRYAVYDLHLSQGGGHEIEEDNDGEWVTYDDYAALEAENAILKQMWWDANDVTDLAGTIVDLESKLAKVEVALSEIQRWLPKHIAGEIARKTLLELRKD